MLIHDEFLQHDRSPQHVIKGDSIDASLGLEKLHFFRLQVDGDLLHGALSGARQCILSFALRSDDPGAYSETTLVYHPRAGTSPSSSTQSTQGRSPAGTGLGRHRLGAGRRRSAPVPVPHHRGAPLSEPVREGDPATQSDQHSYLAALDEPALTAPPPQWPTLRACLASGSSSRACARRACRAWCVASCQSCVAAVPDGDFIQKADDRVKFRTERRPRPTPSGSTVDIVYTVPDAGFGGSKFHNPARRRHTATHQYSWAIQVVSGVGFIPAGTVDVGPSCGTA